MNIEYPTSWMLTECLWHCNRAFHSFDANYVVRLSQSNQVQNTIQCMHIYAMCMIHLKKLRGTRKNCVPQRVWTVWQERYQTVSSSAIHSIFLNIQHLLYTFCHESNFLDWKLAGKFSVRSNHPQPGHPRNSWRKKGAVGWTKVYFRKESGFY